MPRCWACHIPNHILLPSAPLGCGDPAEGDGSNRRLLALGSLQPGEETSCCRDRERLTATPASGPAKTPGRRWRAPGISRGPRDGGVVPGGRAGPYTWALSSSSVARRKTSA